MGEWKFPFVYTIHPQSTMFVMGVKIKATGESKLNDSPVTGQLRQLCSTSLSFHSGYQLAVCYVQYQSEVIHNLEDTLYNL